MALVYTAKTVTGVVYVLSADGQTRVLREGDRVLRGDTLITGAGARAQLVADDAPPLDLQAERQIKIDDSMFADSAPTPASAALAGGSVASVAVVVQALTPSDDQAPDPQALDAVGGSGCGFVRLLRVMEVVNNSDTKFDKDLLFLSMNDRDSTALVLTDGSEAELTAPGVGPAAALLLSDVLASEAELVFAEEVLRLDSAEQVEPACIDLNVWMVSQMGGVLAHCHPSTAEG